MKPLKFDYADPQELDEALAVLARSGDEAKVLAGGQSLMPMLAMRLAYPSVLIDINRIQALKHLEQTAGGWRFGALVRAAAAEDSAALQRDIPVVRKALGWVGHRTIRNRGTVVGSLAHADPSAEMPAVMTALDAEVTAQSASAERQIPVADLFEMPMVSRLEPDEMLVGLDVASRPVGEGSAVVEVARRHGDFALAGIVALLALDPDDVVESASIVSFATGPRPIRLTESEEAVIGSTVDEATLSAAGAAAAAAIDPADDLHATAAYRRSVTNTLTRRALAAAAADSRDRMAAVEGVA